MAKSSTGVTPIRHNESHINLVAHGMSHTLMELASGLLAMSLRMDGTYPAMPMPAEFQALDIMLADLARKMPDFRAVLVPGQRQ